MQMQRDRAFEDWHEGDTVMVKLLVKRHEDILPVAMLLQKPASRVAEVAKSLELIKHNLLGDWYYVKQLLAETLIEGDSARRQRASYYHNPGPADYVMVTLTELQTHIQKEL